MINSRKQIYLNIADTLQHRQMKIYYQNIEARTIGMQETDISLFSPLRWYFVAKNDQTSFNQSVHSKCLYLA